MIAVKVIILLVPFYQLLKNETASVLLLFFFIYLRPSVCFIKIKVELIIHTFIFYAVTLSAVIDCISLLLKHGADARCSDHNGNTPLDLAKDPDSKNLLQKALQHPELHADDIGK